MLEDIKKTLWATADKLRANMDAAEYKHLVLGLIFVKYISDTFAARRAELTARLTNPADDYYFADATPADLAQELEDRDYYKEVNAFWVPASALAFSAETEEVALMKTFNFDCPGTLFGQQSADQTLRGAARSCLSIQANGDMHKKSDFLYI